MPVINRYSQSATTIPQATESQESLAKTPDAPTAFHKDQFEPASSQSSQRTAMRAMAQSVDVRWQLFGLLEGSDRDLIDKCCKMVPADLHHLAYQFTRLSKEDLATFSNTQLVRLVQVFLGEGFDNARLSNLDAKFKDLSEADFARLRAKLPEAVNEMVDMMRHDSL